MLRMQNLLTSASDHFPFGDVFSLQGRARAPIKLTLCAPSFSQTASLASWLIAPCGRFRSYLNGPSVMFPWGSLRRNRSTSGAIFLHDNKTTIKTVTCREGELVQVLISETKHKHYCSVGGVYECYRPLNCFVLVNMVYLGLSLL